MRIGLGVGLVVVAIVMAACIGPDTSVSGAPGDGPPPVTGTVEVHAIAAPTCPVERESQDPACAPRPVVGAHVVVSPADGRDIAIASGVTDERGLLVMQVAVGEYLVSASEVEGLMGRPEPVPARVTPNATVSVTLEYDTGIR